MANCENGEDFRYLTCCAVAQDFSTLVSGLVLPSHLSPHGEAVALWLLQYKQDTAERWPPDLDTLLYHFPPRDGYGWLSDIPQGVDPTLAAYEVLNGVHVQQCIDLMLAARALTTVGLWGEDRNEIIQKTRAALDTLGTLTSPRKHPTILGSDADEFLAALHGTSNPFAHLDSPMLSLDDALAPFTPGVYTFYGRPGTMKSIWLLIFAVSLSMGKFACRVLLVDPENAKIVQLLRLGGLIAGVDTELLLSYSRKKAKADRGDRVTYTIAEMDALAAAEAVIPLIQAQSNIAFLGNDDIPDGEEGMRTELVVETARRHGAQILLLDQAHVLLPPEVARKGKSDEHVRIRATATYFSNLKEFLVIATTQQNRQTEFKVTTGSLPHPTGAEAFGGDGLYQKSAGMVHLWALPLEDGTVLLVFTVVKSRNKPAGYRSFLRIKPFVLVEELSYAEGTVLAEAVLAKYKQERVETRRSASAKAAGVPSSGVTFSKESPSLPSIKTLGVHARVDAIRARDTDSTSS